MKKNSNQKVIVISGGSEGLGREMARLLTPRHKVIILARHEDRLKKTAEEFGCVFYGCDVSDWAAVKHCIGKAINHYKRIDCVINNAGQWIEGKLDKNDPRKIAELIGANTTGTIFLTKAVLPQMKKQKDGLIINIVSQAGLSAKAERSVYYASKWAITGFTKSLQLELPAHGIRVTGVYPGKMATNLYEGLNKDMRGALDPAYVAKGIEYIVNEEKPVMLTEFGIKNIDD